MSRTSRFRFPKCDLGVIAAAVILFGFAGAAVLAEPADSPARDSAQFDAIERPQYLHRSKTFAREQATIKALVVHVGDDGRMVGLATDVIATAQDRPQRSADRLGEGATDVVVAEPGSARSHTVRVHEGLELLGETGKEMRISLDEAMRAVRMRYPDWGGQWIEISFGDKYTPKDGGSAGAAFGVLMLSILEGIDLDPAVAVTGDVTVDWKIRKIGGVPAKLRGALLSKCDYALVPEDNSDSVSDADLLCGDDLLWDLQIFSISRLQDDLALVRRDRPANIRQAMDLFAELQKLPRARRRAMLRLESTRNKLRQILELAPNHLSAKILLERATSRRLPRLTASASLDELACDTFPCRDVLWPGGSATVRSLFSDEETKAVDTHSVALARQGLLNLQRICHPTVEPLLGQVLTFLSDYDQYQSGEIKADVLEQRRHGLIRAYSDLSLDRDMLENLIHEGAQ